MQALMRSWKLWVNFFFLYPPIVDGFQPPKGKRTRPQTHLAAKKVVVVGGGIGGLAVAARVASELGSQVEVTILEKNSFLGGRSGSFHVQPSGKGKFRHERGPSLLLLPDVYRDVFRDCGSSPEAHGLEMLSCNPAYQVVFEDGDRVDVGFPRPENGEVSDEEKLSRDKMNEFEPNGSTKWDEYLRACEAYLDCGLPNFIEQKLDLGSFPAFLRESLRDMGKAWPLKPHSDVLDSFFTSDKMVALASFQDLYVGLEPFRDDEKFAGGVLTTTAPAVFGLLAAIELHPTNTKCGVFAPKGGFHSVTRSLVSLATSKGVNVVTDAYVTRITENKVEFESNEGKADLRADVTVINADLPYASKVLVDANRTDSFPRYDWDDRYRFSGGVIAFHWSIKKQLKDLRVHNVFLTSNGRDRILQSWSSLRDDSGNPTANDVGPVNFYVHRPAAVDPSASPPVGTCGLI